MACRHNSWEFLQLRLCPGPRDGRQYLERLELNRFAAGDSGGFVCWDRVSTASMLLGLTTADGDAVTMDVLADEIQPGRSCSPGV